MAERVVIATLDIDESGAVRSVKAVEQQIGSLAKNTKVNADVFTRHMFNMRSAATAFLGAFSLAGIAYGFKSFIDSVYRASPQFDEFSRALDRVTASTVRLYGSALGVDRQLSDLEIVLNGIANVTDRVKDAAASSPTMGYIGKFLFGQTALGQLRQMLADAASIVGGMGLGGAAPPAPFVDSKAVDNWEAAVKEAVTSAIYYESWQAVINKDIREAVKLTGDWNEELDLAGNALREAGHPGEGFMEPGFGTNLGFERPGGAGLFTEENIGTIDSYAEAITEATNAYMTFGTVASAAYDAINAAATSGVLSQQTAARIGMAIMAVESIMKGKIELAEAVAAAASYRYGAAALHGTAAGLYFAAAAFYGKGAISGASGGGGGRERGFSGAGQIDQRPPAPQITIILEGSISDVRLREITGGVVKAITDGAGGGQIILAGA